MKIVVIGASGLIGSKLVNKLGEHGHDAVAASPDSGVDTLTGDGLDEALEGASVVVDVSNSPSFEDAAVMEFFKTATGNVLAAEAAAGVGHHVALSVVGTERLTEGGYFRAKLAQEQLIESSSIPYSIVRATQFHEFMKRIAADATAGNTVRLPPALIQPMAADDVASAVGRVSVGAPLNVLGGITGLCAIRDPGRVPPAVPAAASAGWATSWRPTRRRDTISHAAKSSAALPYRTRALA